MNFRFQKLLTAIGTVLSCPLCKATLCKDLTSYSHKENVMILYSSVGQYLLMLFGWILISPEPFEIPKKLIHVLHPLTKKQLYPCCCASHLFIFSFMTGFR